jgi:predicted small integral membrane protein
MKESSGVSKLLENPMLLNPFSIMMLLVASISTILVLYGSVLSLKVRGNWTRCVTATGQHNGIQNRIHFVLLIASTVLVLRLLSYPLFYTTLQSFVKDIEGAMCLYGVTQVSPKFFTFLEITKPFVFFFIGQWLILHYLTRHNRTQSVITRKLIFLLGVNLVVLLDSVGDLVLFLSIDFHVPVTCCTINTDSPDRVSAILSRYLVGRQYEQFLLPAYYLSNLFVLGLVGYLFRRRRLEAKETRRRRSLGMAFLSLMNFFLSSLALSEVIGPRLMDLPYHHCPYCLLQYVPDSCLIIGFLMLGTFGFGWSFGLEIVLSTKETVRNLSRYLQNLYRFSFLCLTVSMVMVSLHLLLAG